MKLTKMVIGLTLFVAAMVLLLTIGVGWFIAPRDDLQKSDMIIVVSGGDTAKRTQEGVRLWKDDWAPIIAFSGAAADKGTSNAAVMRSQAIASGVPANAILVEEGSTNTIENAELLKPIVASQNAKRVIVVSSPYHTRRVKVTFEKVFGPDYQFIMAPAIDSQWARSSWWKQPETIDLTWQELKKTLYVAFVQK